MPSHIYKHVELTGSSPLGMDVRVTKLKCLRRIRKKHSQRQRGWRP